MKKILSIVVILGLYVAEGASSSKFTIDTRGKDSRGEFYVENVWCDFCEGEYGASYGRRATFLSGVQLQINFSVEIDAGSGDKCKTLSHYLVNGSRVNAASTFKYNVGSLSAGDELEVVAVATDGARTKPFRVNFDIATPANNARFFASQHCSDRVIYETVNLTTIKITDALNGSFEIMSDKLPISLVGGIEARQQFDSATAQLTMSGSGGVVGERQWDPFGIAAKGTKYSIGKLGQGFDISAMLKYTPVHKWDAVRQCWRETTKALGVEVSCKALPVRYRIPQTLGLVYAFAGFEGGAEIAGVWDSNGAFDFKFESDRLLGVVGGVGAGEEHLLAVEGYLKGGIPFGAKGPSTPHLERLGLNFSAGWKYAALGMSAKGGEFSRTHWLVGGPRMLMRNRLGINEKIPDYSDFKPIPRSYLAKPKLMRLMSVGAESSLGADNGESVIVENGYTQPDPLLASCNGVNVLAYLMDDPQRIDVNRSKLVCATGRGHEFAGSNAVWDDGTPDFKPSVGIDAAGTVVLAWMNGKQTYAEDSSLEQLLGGSEIAVGIRNPSTGAWACRNITDDQILDHSPVVAVSQSGRYCVAWIRNAANNIIGSSEESNEIVGAFYDHGVWSEPIVLQHNKGQLSKLDMVTNGEKAILVFEERSGVEDSEARALKCIDWTFAGPIGESILADNVQAGDPMVEYLADNHPWVFCQDGNSIKRLDVANGNCKSYELGLESLSPLLFVKGENGNVAALSRKSNSDIPFTSDPVVHYYDAKNETWSNAIELMQNDRQERSISAILTADERLLMAYSSAATTQNEDGTLVYGGVDVRVFSKAHGADLAISPEDIYFSTNGVSATENKIALCAKIHNIGDVIAQSVPIAILVGEDETALENISSDELTVDVSAGDVVEVEVPWTVNVDVSDLFVRVEIDPQKLTLDINRQNNVAMREAVESIRVCDAGSWEDFEENTRILTATICNEGFRMVPAGTDVIFRRVDGTVIGIDTIGSVMPGENGKYEASVVWNLKGLSFAGAYEDVTVEIVPPDEYRASSNQFWTASFQVMTSLDSDEDGLLDGEELRLGTEILNADTDGDSCSDGLEVHERFTDPLVADKYTVTFDAGQHGRIVSGKANQTACQPIAPEIKVDSGWRFAGWDCDLDRIWENKVIHALYVREDGVYTETVGWFTLTYKVQSGFATIQSGSCSYYTAKLPSVLGNCPVTEIGSCAFFNMTDSNLMNLTIPEGVTNIGFAAFMGCSSLRSVALPSSLRSIGWMAFNACSALTTVSLQPGLKSIGDNAFSGCTALSAISIPESVTEIGSGAFSDCSELSEINIPESVIDIGSGAFRGCVSLGSGIVYRDKCLLTVNGMSPIEVTIKEGTRLIAGGAFSEFATLESVDVPPSVEYVCAYAFGKCSNLRFVRLPDGLKRIGSQVFYQCEALESLKIPESVTEIDSYAFSGCTSLKSMDLPTGLKFVENGLFSDCDKLEHVEIPSGVTNIGYYAFQNCSGLAEILIPSCVMSIGDSAFYGCSALKEIEIPAGVPWIGESVFNGCSGLSEMIIPTGVTRIGRSAFSGCSALTEISIPPSVTNIGSWAFENCKGLTSITIPECVTVIGSSAFSGCHGLEKMVLPFVGARRGNTGTWDSVFGYVFGTTSYQDAIETTQYYSSNSSAVYYIPSSLRTVIITDESHIGYGAFSSCSSLTSVLIPESVTGIGERAFSACGGLLSISLPAGVTSVGQNAFWRCSGLLMVKIPQCIVSLSSTFPAAYLKIEEVQLCDGVNTIATSLFSHCVGLKSITIPPSVRSIGEDAFFWCKELESVHISDMSAWCRINFANSDSNPLHYAHDLYLNETLITDLLIPPDVTSVRDELFFGCSNLISVTIPSSVTSIGDSAFYGCNALESVEIPASVTRIGDSAFYGCSALESVEIPANVVGIGASAFHGCSGLKSVTLPSGLTSIPDHAFSGCSKLTGVLIPSSVTSLGVCSFYGCSGLTSIAIPSAVTTIYYNAFGGCTNLQSVSIPQCATNLRSVFPDAYGTIENVIMCDGVATVERYAFSGCTGLTSVTIPSSVTNVGDCAFRDCSGLTSVHITDLETWCKIVFENYNSNPLHHGHKLYLDGKEILDLVIPEGITEINDYAFYGYSGMRSARIPDGVTHIGSLSFGKCDGLTSIAIPDGVTAIGRMAFSNCSKLASITIPPSVMSMGDSAFSGCFGLGEMVLPFVGAKRGNNGTADSLFGYVFGPYSYPEAVEVRQYYKSSYSSTYYIPLSLKNVVITDETYIGYGAFYGCNELTSLSVLGSVTDVGDYAFCGCSGLTSIVMPSRLSKINGRVFYNCSGLNSVTIPESVTSIGDYAFYGCSGLVSVMISSNVVRVGTSAFLGCSGLKSVTIPQCATRLSSTFPSAYKSIENVVLCDGVTRISSDAFSGCSKLSSVLIPDGVADIGSYAFQKCGALKSITLPSGMSSIGSYAFQNCSGLTSLMIPDSVTTIGSDAFQNCNGLTYVTIPAGLTIIDQEVFWGCNRLKSLMIPEGVTTIRYMAFQGCDGLESVMIPSSVTKIDSSAFYSCSKLDKVYVVKGDVNRVKALYSWPSCVTFEEILQVVVPADVAGGKSIVVDENWVVEDLDRRFGVGTAERFKNKFGNDLSAALLQPSGKTSADGSPMYVWHDYVAGTDPTNPESKFKVEGIKFVDGELKVTWSPDLNEDGTKIVRKYTEYGRKELGGSESWIEMEKVNPAEKNDYKFRKVTVDMP